MKHLDEGTILAVRDGGPVTDSVRAHLDECATCAAVLAAARGRADRIEQTLTALDRPIEPTAARAGVRARLRDSADVGATSWWSGRHLGRAAALLLVTAGAASALPGSPLRSLWSPPDPEPVAASESTPAPVETSPAAATADLDVGIAVAVPDGAVHVVVRGADPGTDVSVRWSDRASARVSAPAGSRFTYSAGRVEVDASRGAIRIELPSAAGDVSLELDGRMYLEGAPDSLAVLGPAVERTPDSIRFRVDEE